MKFVIALLLSTQCFAAEPTPRPVSDEAKAAQRSLICWWPEKGTPERIQDIRNKKQAAHCNE